MDPFIPTFGAVGPPPDPTLCVTAGSAIAFTALVAILHICRRLGCCVGGVCVGMHMDKLMR